MLPLFMFTMGIALICAVSNVFFEDTQHLVEVIFKALYFLCPILYGREMLPQWLLDWVVINPLFGIIEFTRDIFYHGVLPDSQTYMLNLATSFFVLGLGLWIFHRADKKFIYFL